MRRTTGTNRDLLLIRQQNASEKSIGWCKVCFSSVTCNYKCFQQRLVLSLLCQRCRVNAIFTSLLFHPKYQLRKFAWWTNQKGYKWSENNIFSHMRFSNSARIKRPVKKNALLDLPCIYKGTKQGSDNVIWVNGTNIWLGGWGLLIFSAMEFCKDPSPLGLKVHFKPKWFPGSQ